MTNRRSAFMGLAGLMLGMSARTQPRVPVEVCVDGECTELHPAGFQVRSAAEFIASIGVNVHFNQLSTPYVTRYARVREKLIESGIRHLRDGAMDVRGTFAGVDQAATFRELGEAGLRFTFIFNPDVAEEFVTGYPAHVAPAFEAYEYPNELNARRNFDWQGTLRSWGPRFHGYIRNNPKIAHYPIVGPSLVDVSDLAMLPNLSEYLDYGNIHAYYISHHPATSGYGARGVAPCNLWRYGALDYKTCIARLVSGAKPIMATEAGWGTEATTKNPVPEALQAKYLARMLLNHYLAGIPRTHIYQFIESGEDTFQSFGILNAEGGEKPAFRTIKALIAALHDVNPASALRPVEFVLSGDTKDVRATVLQKSDGSYRVILWIEKSGFDSSLREPIAIAPRELILQVGSGVRVGSALNFQEDGTARESSPVRLESGGYAVQVTDHLTIVELRQ